MNEKISTKLMSKISVNSNFMEGPFFFPVENRLILTNDLVMQVEAKVKPCYCKEIHVTMYRENNRLNFCISRETSTCKRVKNIIYK